MTAVGEIKLLAENKNDISIKKRSLLQQPFLVSSRNAPALPDDTKNGCVADYKKRGVNLLSKNPLQSILENGYDSSRIYIANSMICSDIWHKYHA